MKASSHFFAGKRKQIFIISLNNAFMAIVI